MLDLDRVIAAIKEHQGEEFFTPTKRVPFTYQLEGKLIVISNTKFRIYFAATVKTACRLLNDGASRSTFRNNVHGPSYLRALLQDERIVGVQESVTNSVKTGRWFQALLTNNSGQWKDNVKGTSYQVRINGTNVEVKTQGHASVLITKTVARAHFYLIHCHAA